MIQRVELVVVIGVSKSVELCVLIQNGDRPLGAVGASRQFERGLWVGAEEF